MSKTQVTISVYLNDISQWMSAHHLKFNPEKTELLLLPGKASPIHDLSINTENSSSDCMERGDDTGWPTVFRWNHHCDNTLLQINFPQHQEDTSVPHPGGSVDSASGFCHFVPRLAKWLLAGVPACAIRPCSSSRMQQPGWSLAYPSSPTLLIRSLHWLPEAAWIQFKTLILAYRAAIGSGPSYILHNSLFLVRVEKPHNLGH